MLMMAELSKVFKELNNKEERGIIDCKREKERKYIKKKTYTTKKKNQKHKIIMKMKI